LPRFSIRTKLIGGYALVIAVMAVLTVISIQALNQSSQRTHTFADETVPSTDIVSGLVGPLAEYRMMQYASILNSEAPAKVIQQVDDLLAQYKTEVDTTLDGYGRYVASPREGSFVDELRADWERYLAISGQALTRARGGRDIPGAIATMESQAEGGSVPAYQASQDVLTRWRAYKEQLTRQQRDDAQSATSSARTKTLILLGIAIVVAALVALLISRGITRSVRDVLDRLGGLRDQDTTELRHGLRSMADGDLTRGVACTTEPIERIAGDELGDVAGAVNEIRDNTAASVEAYNETRASLARMIGEVQTTAGGVASASQQVASTSEEAGRAVGEIATAVGEVARGAEEQVRMVDAARGSAEATSRAAEEARSVAEDGASAAAQASEAMGAVRESTVQVTEAIRALAAKSDEIGGIVATITGISEQTNLLALNAAIEAARAGESGRGFAVVAEEVRKLAEESQRAAAAIGRLIDQVQSETERAVEVVEQGAQRSDEGAAVVEQARVAFERIATAVRDMGERIGEIATATTEVASVAEQSSASTEQVSASTQQTSASTQQIAASAQELSRSAQELEHLVSRFTVAA
jgi:methyl-accepting chemotaxis protein